MQYPYTYDDLLFRIHTEKCSEEVYNKINLPALKCRRHNRTTVIINFSLYPEKLRRTKEQLGDYFRLETGSSNSINQNGQLVIQCIINEHKCETLLKNYIKEYVLCRQCKCLDTSLIKETGLNFLQCHQCHAKTSLGKN